MLLKLVSLGHSGPIWKNVVHHLRRSLQGHELAESIHAGAADRERLLREGFPHAWLREAPDALLCEPPAGVAWRQSLQELQRLGSLPEERPPLRVLALHALELGLKQLIQTAGHVTVQLDNASRFELADPGLIIRRFPARYPRVPVQDLLGGLVFAADGEGAAPRSVQSLAPGTVVGWGELRAILRDGEALDPQDWLPLVLRGVRSKTAREHAAVGLIREARGLFLFPGVPAGRVRQVELGGVPFPHLLDLGQMSLDSPQFAALVEALVDRAEETAELWEGATARLRQAEAMTDLRVVCGGGAPLLNKTLRALLQQHGFQRCEVLHAPGEGLFREPVLLMLSAPWNQGDLGHQVEAPRVLSLMDDLATGLAELEGTPGTEGIPGWSTLDFDPALLEGAQLGLQGFRERHQRHTARWNKAQEGLALAANRLRLLEQEVAVLEEAQGNLQQLLGAEDTVVIWSGSLPSPASQVLVFSYDQEEAGTVLQALAGVPKKRWFDLSPFTSADTLRKLTLEPVRGYLDGGVMLMTHACRERLERLAGELAQDLAEARRSLEDSREAQDFYTGERARVQAERERLARRWAVELLRGWLAANEGRVHDGLAAIRARQERAWFNRATVHRVAVVCARGENQPPLLEACRTLYPGWNEEHSRICPYHYQPFDTLPEDEAARLAARADQGHLTVEEHEALRASTLVGLNEAMFSDYLQVLRADLGQLKADLLVIEHRFDVARAILEHLRAELPHLAEVPAVLILPEPWAPLPGQALPWPGVRVVPLRRLEPLRAKETTAQLRALYAT